jgi:hypothetical protein
MAEAFAAHGITVYQGRVTWSDAIEVMAAELCVS